MGDDEDLAPLMGARQRRLGGEAPYRDDPVSTNEEISQVLDCDGTTRYEIGFSVLHMCCINIMSLLLSCVYCDTLNSDFQCIHVCCMELSMSTHSLVIRPEQC
jgi:hypothetical protein